MIPTCVEPRLYPIASQVTAIGHLDLVWIGTSSTLKGLVRARDIWSALAEAFPG